MDDKPLTFGYSAIALFRDAKFKKTELRVILVQAENLTQALEKADKLMCKYADEFEVEYSGTVNAYEFGSDLMDEYGEMFSTTWDSDKAFDAAFEDKLLE